MTATLTSPDLAVGQQIEIEVVSGSDTGKITIIGTGGGGGTITSVVGEAPIDANTLAGVATISFTPTPPGVGTTVLTDTGGVLSWSPGTPGPTTAWPGAATAIAAGATPTLAQHAAQAHYIDSTGAAATVTMPAAPVDGDTVTLILRGATVTPAHVAPNAGQTIDDPANPGAAAAGNVNLTFAGQSVTWLWVAALTGWVLLVNS